MIGYSLIPDAFFEAFVDLYKRRYNTDFLKEDMVYVSGVVAAIDAIFRTYTKKGDNIVMLSPIYHTFYSCIKNNGCNALTSKLLNNKGIYTVNWQDLEEKLKDKKTKILLLCNPHNPIGKIFREDELMKIDALASKYKVLVISDEIHGLITNPGLKYVPYSNVAKGKYVTCLATSKAFNLAGLQSAVIVCKDKKTREELQDKFYADDIGEPNYFAINANIAALRDSEDWLDAVNEYIYENKKYFNDYIFNNIPGLRSYITEATYMMWIDVRSYYNDSVEFVKKLDEATGLRVCPGHQFGEGGDYFFRINLATSFENVKDACHRLESFIKGNY